MAQSTNANLAFYATRSDQGGQRAHPEPADPLRDPFELDCHRIIESTAFRRLEGKTQVFAAAHHDHFRTRMTHTLEAAHIARCLARQLRLNEALAEAIMLGHDLGHPPFGHAGEAALNEAMHGPGGFNHNTHSIRVVEYLEHPFPPFRGLNLTLATRTGLATHATHYDTPSRSAMNCELPGSLEAQIASIADRIAYNCHDLEDAIGAEFVSLEQLSTIALWQEAWEASVALLSSSVDGSFRGSGHCSRAVAHPRHALPEDERGELSPDGALPQNGPIDPQSTPANVFAIRRPVLDAMLNTLLTDAIRTSQSLLSKLDSATGSPSDDSLSGALHSSPLAKGGKRGVVRSTEADNALNKPESAAGPSNVDPPSDADSSRGLKPARSSKGASRSSSQSEAPLAAANEIPLVKLSGESDAKLAELECFLSEHVYQHPEIKEMDTRGHRMVLSLFDAYRKAPGALPARFAARIPDQGLDRVICDYLAGMTDRFCQTEFQRLVGKP